MHKIYILLQNNFLLRDLKILNKLLLVKTSQTPWFDKEIKRAIKNINSNCNGNNTTSNPKHIKLFFHKQLRHEIELKNIIHEHLPADYNNKIKLIICNNVSLTDSNNKIKLIIYYPKFNTTKLIISNNFSTSTSYLSTTNIVYKFKCPLRKCFSNKMNTYMSLTTTTVVETFNTSTIQY